MNGSDGKGSSHTGSTPSHGRSLQMLRVVVTFTRQEKSFVEEQAIGFGNSKWTHPSFRRRHLNVNFSTSRDQAGWNNTPYG
jgi:hypothetical protein